MLEVRDAVKTAFTYLVDLLHIDPEQQRLNLEEVGLTEDERDWQVTFSLEKLVKNERPAEESNLDRILGIKTSDGRSWKTIKVRREDGAFVALKNGRLN